MSDSPAPASSDDDAPELEAVPAPTSEGATEALEWHAPTLVRIDETCTIPRLLQDRVGRSPRRPLILRKLGMGDAWRPVSARDFHEEVQQVAAGLIARGLEPGQRVAIMSRTRYEWTLLDFACWSAGLVPVPIYETSSIEQVAHVLSDADVDLVVTETVSLAEIVRTAAERTGRHHVVVLSLDSEAIETLVADGAGVPRATVAARTGALTKDDISTIVYTSGTTGTPKGTVLTHENFTNLCLNSHAWMPEIAAGEDSRLLLFLPLAHVFARFLQVFQISGNGVIAHVSNIKNLLPDLASFRPSYLLVVPRVLEKIYNSADAKASKGAKKRVFRWAAHVAIEYSRALDTPEGPSRSLRAQRALADKLVFQISGNGVMAHVSNIKNLLPDLASFRPSYLLVVPRVLEKIYNSADAKASKGAKRRIFRWAAHVAIEYSKALDTPEGPSRSLRAQRALADKLVFQTILKLVGGNARYIVSGGAPLATWLGHFYRGLGIPVLEGYGLTETVGPVSVNTPRLSKIGTVGPALPPMSFRVSDEGEILLKGPSVFQGYNNDPEATAACFTEDGWFKTGDLGSLDRDGYVRITGRAKEIIVTAGGKNVAPAALENPMRSHPLISQVLVVGDQRPFVAALITLDAEMLPVWLESHGLPVMSVAEAATNVEVLASLQKAVDGANEHVSRAESIRKFKVLTSDFTEANGLLTPSLKVKRAVAVRRLAPVIDELYGGPVED